MVSVYIKEVDSMMRVLRVLLAISVCLALVGCGSTYEDTNGEDNYELQTITEENIIQQNVGSSGFGTRETKLPLGITSTEYYSKNFNGVYEFYMTNYLFASRVEVYVGHLNVEKGNFRISVVCDDEILFDIPLDSFNESYYFEDISGTFAIRVAGESAAFDFYIEVR